MTSTVHSPFKQSPQTFWNHRTEKSPSSVQPVTSWNGHRLGNKVLWTLTAFLLGLSLSIRISTLICPVYSFRMMTDSFQMRFCFLIIIANFYWVKMPSSELIFDTWIVTLNIHYVHLKWVMWLSPLHSQRRGGTEKLTRLTSLDSTPRVSDSVGLGWGLRICLCYKFSGDAHAVSGDRI